MDDPADAVYMERVMELARAGIGLTSPNPRVGAVVVNGHGEIVGEGTHTYDGLKHAEILALEQASKEAAGSTLYLNLEPCSHTGRTGPCADAVIEAGVTRVVAAIEDPNPVVAGAGFEKLRQAGVEVSVGVGEQQARRINESFAKFIRTRRPLVMLKTAMTLDGKIAPPAETRRTPERWITNEIARKHVQWLRHESDAILVGVGTVIADDPLLTDRSGLARRRSLLRVVLDSHLRIPIQSKIVQTADRDLMVFCTDFDEEKANALRARSVCIERVAGDDSGRPKFDQVISRLGEMDITSVMIEGGSNINSQAVANGVVDKVFLYYAPKVLGEGAVPFLAGKGLQCDSLSVKITEVHRFGSDFAVEGYVRDPYEQKGL